MSSKFNKNVIDPCRNVGLDQAIRYFGTQAELGRKLGVSKSAVTSWVKKRNKIPAHIAVSIENITNGTVLREALRPDLFIR